jgi:hypothetical protein
VTLGKARRRELGKFILDLGRVIFGGTVVTQLFSTTGGSAVILLSGFAATIVMIIVGLAIIPED